jgi:hypothetical protein
MSDNNGRHPVEPGDTDWGQKVDKQHAANTTRLDGIDARLNQIDTHIIGIVGEQEKMAVAIGRLDERMKASESDRKMMREELSVNTLLTKSIKDDTAMIVRISRGARALKLFLIWAAPVAASILTFYFTWTGRK